MSENLNGDGIVRDITNKDVRDMCALELIFQGISFFSDDNEDIELTKSNAKGLFLIQRDMLKTYKGSVDDHIDMLEEAIEKIDSIVISHDDCGCHDNDDDECNNSCGCGSCGCGN